MKLSLSFNNADAILIEKYAAERNMSVLDFVMRAVMKSVAEETERAERKAAMLAPEKKGLDMAGVRNVVEPFFGGTTKPQSSPGFTTDDSEKETGKKKESNEHVFRDSWDKWLGKTFGIAVDGTSNEHLLANARHAFDEFQALTAARLGSEKSRSRFFSLCEKLPLVTRKKILSTVDPHQLALTLSEFASEDFKKEFQAMAAAYKGKSFDIPVETKESCIALFSVAGNVHDGIRNAVVEALEAFVSITAPLVGKQNAAKTFMRLAQYIPKPERQKMLLAMSPQAFGEMLVHFLF